MLLMLATVRNARHRFQRDGHRARRRRETAAMMTASGPTMMNDGMTPNRGWERARGGREEGPRGVGREEGAQ